MAGRQVRDIQGKALRALAVLDRHVPVVCGYLFGSYVEGTADEDSDIDVAAFVDTAEELDIRRKVELMSAVQEAIGDDVEVHLFPASVMDGADPASFATFVVRRGRPLAYKPSATP
jgi:predicted nucleotidyltransferase